MCCDLNPEVSIPDVVVGTGWLLTDYFWENLGSRNSHHDQGSERPQQIIRSFILSRLEVVASNLNDRIVRCSGVQVPAVP